MDSYNQQGGYCGYPAPQQMQQNQQSQQPAYCAQQQPPHGYYQAQQDPQQSYQPQQPPQAPYQQAAYQQTPYQQAPQASCQQPYQQPYPQPDFPQAQQQSYQPQQAQQSPYQQQAPQEQTYSSQAWASFRVDPAMKKQMSRETFPRGASGKALIIIGILCLVAGILVAVISRPLDFNSRDAERNFIVLTTSVLLFVAGIVVLCGGFRQKNAKVGMRGDESLSLNGGWLVYEYRELGGIYNSGSSGQSAWCINTIAIELAQTFVSYNPQTGKLVFTGGIDASYRPLTSPSNDMSARKPVKMDPFELTCYFQPSLPDVLSQSIAPGRFTVAQ